jgi:hypothetical protein
MRWISTRFRVHCCSSAAEDDWDRPRQQQRPEAAQPPLGGGSWGQLRFWRATVANGQLSATIGLERFLRIRTGTTATTGHSRAGRLVVEQEISGRPPKGRFDQFRMVSYLALQSTR